MNSSKKLIFISYQWDIQQTVNELKNFLENHGIEVWMDSSQIRGGNNLNDKLADAIIKSDAVIACITKSYAKSEMCKKELTYAHKIIKKIIPLLFEDASMLELRGVGLIIADLLYINVTVGLAEDNWITSAVDKILEAIRENTITCSEQRAVVLDEPNGIVS